MPNLEAPRTLEQRPIATVISDEVDTCEATSGFTGNFWQVVVSLDYNFDIANGIYGIVEHLYNGNALGFGEGRPGNLMPLFEREGPLVAPGSQALFGTSRVVTNADHQTAVSLTLRRM